MEIKQQSMKRIAIDYIMILALSIGWFLILPMQFSKQSDISQTHWQWLGGYHGLFESFIKTSPSETVAHMNKYHIDNYWYLALIFLLAVLLAVGTYMFMRKLIHRIR